MREHSNAENVLFILTPCGVKRACVRREEYRSELEETQAISGIRVHVYREVFGHVCVISRADIHFKFTLITSSDFVLMNMNRKHQRTALELRREASDGDYSFETSPVRSYSKKSLSANHLQFPNEH